MNINKMIIQITQLWSSLKKIIKIYILSFIFSYLSTALLFYVKDKTIFYDNFIISLFIILVVSICTYFSYNIICFMCTLFIKKKKKKRKQIKAIIKLSVSMNFIIIITNILMLILLPQIYSKLMYLIISIFISLLILFLFYKENRWNHKWNIREKIFMIFSLFFCH